MPRKAQGTEPESNLKELGAGNGAEGENVPVICRRLRLYRLQRGMEQKELGRLIGASANTVNNWEKGRSRPDVSFLPAIVRTLGISFEALYGTEDRQQQRKNEKEEKHMALFRSLDAENQYVVERTMKAMLLTQKARKQQEKRPITELPLIARPLAAGIGDPTEYDEVTEPFFLYGEHTRADCVFHVNGDSMEPEYPDGCYVLVEKTGDLRYGEIGAFSTGNELYIKQYERDGLHSLNPAYPVMTFEDERCYLIGRIVGRIEELPSKEEIAVYRALKD